MLYDIVDFNTRIRCTKEYYDESGLAKERYWFSATECFKRMWFTSSTFCGSFLATSPSRSILEENILYGYQLFGETEQNKLNSAT